MSSSFVIGICGKARAGKDTLADLIISEVSSTRQQHNTPITKASMAAPLKKVVGSILSLWVDDPQNGLDGSAVVRRMLDGDLKEAPLQELGGQSPRQMLQTLGTDWGRKMVCDDLWIKVMEGRIKQLGYMADLLHAQHHIVVIPDIRFDNEARLCDVLIHIDRLGTQEVADHESEAGIAPHLITRTVHNWGTTDKLAVLAKEIVTEEIYGRFYQ